MEARCGISEDTPCMHLLALDEANAALKEFREGTTTWVQEGSAALLLDTHGQRAKRRLPIILAANSRHSEVSLTPIKATQQAKTGVLPLRAPTLSEGQELWVAIIERLSLTMTDMDLPEEADVSDPTSGFNFLCRLCGANFRCMAWILEILGGSSGRGGWTHAELASSIAGPKMLRVDSLKEDPLGNLLRDLHAKVYGARWFTSEKWRDKDADDRWHVLTQTVAHALLGKSVILADRIPRSDLQWAVVVADGLAHALYAECAGQEGPGVASEYIKMLSLSASRSPGGVLVYETQPVASPLPSRRPSGALATSPAHARTAGGSEAEPSTPAHARSAGGSEAEPSTPAHARSAGGSEADPSTPEHARSAGGSEADPSTPEHARSAGGSEADPSTPEHARSARGSEAEPSTPAAQMMPVGGSSSKKRSPKYLVGTMVGDLTVAASTIDPMEVPATLLVAPAVLTSVWPYLKFPDGPLVDVVYREDPYRREDVDMQTVHLSVYLLKTVLKEEMASYASLVKGGWLSPLLHNLKFKLPGNRNLLKRIARVSVDWTETERWKAVLNATELAASSTDNDAAAEAAAGEADMTCASYAVIGPGNAGTDGFLQLRLGTNRRLFKIFSQSKKSEVGETTTTTLDSVFEEMKKDLQRHGYVAAKLVTHVPALERKPYERPDEERADEKRRKLQGMCNDKASARNAVLVAGELKKSAVKHARPKKGEAELQTLHEFSYHYITDRRMTGDQHLRHQVLALAGHELAARLVVVDRSAQEQFYGTATAIQRQVAAMRSGRT
ncbi:probable proteoglycan 4 at N-terminal half [Coccomyxa sp. Obi]|nr:probable proteoglycan 4 at N-terminal half [Coccomyxa sp. Obi]